MRRRIKITVSYDGTEYHGWQVQPGLPTIQACLESVLSEIEGAAVAVAGSGRTDAGVHALAQTASFDLRNPIPAANLQRAMNRLLPRSIRVLAVEEQAADFHARFSAKAKTYEYRIWREEICPPFERNYCYHHPYPMTEGNWTACAGVFEGTHDFHAFAAADEKDQSGYSKVRTIFQSEGFRDGSRLIYRVRGSGFLKHMVRLMAGTLLECAKGNLTSEQLRARLRPDFAGKAGPSVPASGLFLISVEY